VAASYPAYQPQSTGLTINSLDFRLPFPDVSEHCADLDSPTAAKEGENGENGKENGKGECHD
jgi:hypothetical protein